jgi:hypothetical protein
MLAMAQDQLIAAPANPATINTDVSWYDTGESGPIEHAGVVGEVLFNQDVTLFVETAPKSGTLRVVKSQVISANTPTEVAVAFRGGRTKLRLRTTGTAPTVWHVNGRVKTEGKLDPVAPTAFAYGVAPMVTGPAGADGAPGADGAAGAPGPTHTGYEAPAPGALNLTKAHSDIQRGNNYTLADGTFNGQPHSLRAYGSSGVSQVAMNHINGGALSDPGSYIEFQAAGACALLAWDAPSSRWAIRIISADTSINPGEEPS